MMFLDAWERYEFPQFRETAQIYGDFFTAYVQNHSRTTASGGLLVDDYYHPNGNLPTHTSLNHQVAQNILVYRLGAMLNRPDLTALGDRMLAGCDGYGTELDSARFQFALCGVQRRPFRRQRLPLSDV